MLNTHTCTQAHMWTCILFDFLLQPCKVALCLFPLDRLSFPVIQNLSFNFTPLQVLPQWLSPSASILFSASCGPTLSYVALTVIIAHPEARSACFSIPHQRWTLCHSCVHPYSAQQRFLHKEQDKQKSVELTVLIWGKRRNLATALRTKEQSWIKSNKQLFCVCRWENKSDLRNNAININMR